IDINVCKTKHATNVRSGGLKDEGIILTPPIILSLEQAINFIEKDELVEITPKNIRLRKKILNSGLRAKANKNN
ncbi:translational GTPase TypA, partial [candidate division WWE3 bacterium CG10_big_fil_rev_8_21_14_0_10_32_10]